jgi:polar amino acid transport system substrate-binding protein
MLPRHRLAIPLSLALLLSLPGLLQAATAPACELRMRWADDPPYSMRLPDGQVGGLMVDLVSQTLARLGCKVTLVELPWARALLELEAGRLEVLSGALRRPEREAYAHFAEPRYRSPNLLFAHAEALALVGGATRLPEVMRGEFRLGAQIGVSYGPDFVKLSADPAFTARLVQASARRNLWQMLALRRVDGVIADEATARYELAALGLSGVVRRTGVVVSDEPSTVMFSRRSVSVEFVERYNRASEALLKDGTQARIVQLYLGD